MFAPRLPAAYRTADGAEIDLLFERGGAIEMAIEIKRSASPAPSRGFHIAREDLQPAEAFVVHAGEETRADSTSVVFLPLHEIVQRLSS